MLARQYLVILNMTPHIREGAKRLAGSFFEQTCHSRQQALLAMSSVFQCIRRLICDECGVDPVPAGPAFDETQGLENYFEQQMIHFHKLLTENGRSHLSTVERVKRLILENISRNVSLQEAADSVFLSPNYFSRIFKEQANENFIDFSIRVKMEAAAGLLRLEPQKKIYQISESLGYRNIKYFYKLFKRVYDCTPSEYRERKTRTEGTA